MTIMGSGQKLAFSENGLYFASYCDDGKLKVWDVESGVLKQEYIPNFHLGSPGTCIAWLKLSIETITPKKKKKLESQERNRETDAVAIGTTFGSILLYSIARGNVIATLESGTTALVNCLSWSRGLNLFSCAGETIIEWGVGEKNIVSSWKSGKDIVRQILVLPDGKFLISASQSIVLWSLPKHEKLKVYTGHASNVSALVFVPPVCESSDGYFISAGASDRYLSAWSLSSDSHNSTVAQFLMQDLAVSICVCPGNEEESTMLSVVTQRGVSHLYTLQLNGKSSKPIKPKLTVQLAPDTSQNQTKEPVVPLPILGVLLFKPKTVLLAYGFTPFLSFEKIKLDYSEKVMCLIREDVKKKIQRKKIAASRVVEPEVDSSAHYLNSMGGQNSGVKRVRKVDQEVPMEERLNNLTLNQSDTNAVGVPQADSVARLLLQALHSKDRRLILSVLLQRDEKIIRRTVSRLPVQVIVPLVEELTFHLQDRLARCQVAAWWLRAIIAVHASQILASPSATECFGPVMGLIQSRLELLSPLMKLRGRLDLIMEQIALSQTKNSEPTFDNLLVYKDSYSSDEDSLPEDNIAHSESDDNWIDLSEGEESEVQDGELDAEMSGE